MRLLGLPPLLTASDDVARHLSEAATLDAALRVEAALARALARAGLATEAEARAAVEATGSGVDLQAVARGTARAGALAIPLVAALREAAGEGAGAIHRGATSQDIADTALVLQLRAALAALGEDVAALRAALSRLAAEHAGTMTLGRTLLQPGPPVTFGLRAAGWLGALGRGWERVAEARDRALVLQFGGAVGTLASLGAAGPRVAGLLAKELALPLPEAPWHAHRDRLAALACALAVLGGSLGKAAGDIALLAQPEIGEVAEPGGGGRGGSSTMPHKRNPTACVVARAAAHRLPHLAASVLAGVAQQEHERAGGAWQAEAAPLAEIVLAVSAALTALREAVEGLQVWPERMRRNIDALGGLPLAERLAEELAPGLGRRAATALVERLCREAARPGGSLLGAAGADPAVSSAITPDRLAELLDPSTYLGSARAFTEALLAAHGHGDSDAIRHGN